MSIVGTINRLFLDVGQFPFSRASARAYARVPKRRDGLPDRRYRASRIWREYLDAQQELAVVAYIAGREQDFIPSEFTLV
jgi:hypothetical protein